jgi:hypothetical protein
MNIHGCVSCADDVNKHGDVQIKRGTFETN